MDELVLVGLGFRSADRGRWHSWPMFGMIDQTLGKRLNEGQEVLTFDLEPVIDKAIEMLVTAKREMAVKNHSIMAGQDGYNGRRESFDKAVHGVLLQSSVWQQLLDDKTPFS